MHLPLYLVNCINRIKSETNNFKYHWYFLDQRTEKVAIVTKRFAFDN